jgi:excisionase family DNA binding protein
MRAYRPGEVADLLGVSADTVRRWADAGRLAVRRDADGRRTIDGAELARFLEHHERAPEIGPVVGRSARNRMTGIVTRVVKDKVAAHVERPPTSSRSNPA